MKQQHLWGALALCVLLSACSVYQGTDVPSEVKEKAEIKRLKAEEKAEEKAQKKHHKQNKEARANQEVQKPQTPQESESKQADQLKQELAPLQATLQQLSTLVEANAKKMQDLDKQLAQQHTPPKPAPQE
ncbi:hypothetical protein, partial [Helicobacter vulpis]|uniref:hypothetical protein n=1 Tax=Helicobacter vulpis TaxID=2316076 RepID=UPI001968DA03